MKWGATKPEREEKEEEERSVRKVGSGLNGRELGAKIYGAELSARVTGVELPAMSSSDPRSLAPGKLALRRVSSAPASMAPS